MFKLFARAEAGRGEGLKLVNCLKLKVSYLQCENCRSGFAFKFIPRLVAIVLNIIQHKSREINI